jgi:hypothetical protein
MATLAPKLPYTHPFAGGFPYRGSQRLPSDPDALTYLAAVAAADGAPVETAVAVAVDDFFKGCKADGTFSALKASCILCGARTLAGALVPLAGDAPTNNNFVDADYNRETGLVGDGSTKYLNSGRENDADPQDDKHVSVYASNAGTLYKIYIGSLSSTPSQTLTQLSRLNATSANGVVNGATAQTLSALPDGFFGITRSSASSQDARIDGATTEGLIASNGNNSFNLFAFARNTNGTATEFTDARLAFYSIGESLDLALLDARVSALVTAIGAAL